MAIILVSKSKDRGSSPRGHAIFSLLFGSQLWYTVTRFASVVFNGIAHRSFKSRSVGSTPTGGTISGCSVNVLACVASNHEVRVRFSVSAPRKKNDMSWLVRIKALQAIDSLYPTIKWADHAYLMEELKKIAVLSKLKENSSLDRMV